MSDLPLLILALGVFCAVLVVLGVIADAIEARTPGGRRDAWDRNHARRRGR